MNIFNLSEDEAIKWMDLGFTLKVYNPYGTLALYKKGEDYIYHYNEPPNCTNYIQ